MLGLRVMSKKGLDAYVLPVVKLQGLHLESKDSLFS
jgi:hypothetical protein